MHSCIQQKCLGNFVLGFVPAACARNPLPPRSLAVGVKPDLPVGINQIADSELRFLTFVLEQTDLTRNAQLSSRNYIVARQFGGLTTTGTH